MRRTVFDVRRSTFGVAMVYFKASWWKGNHWFESKRLEVR